MKKQFQTIRFDIIMISLVLAVKCRILTKPYTKAVKKDKPSWTRLSLAQLRPSLYSYILNHEVILNLFHRTDVVKLYICIIDLKQAGAELCQAQ